MYVINMLVVVYMRCGHLQILSEMKNVIAFSWVKLIAIKRFQMQGKHILITHGPSDNNVSNSDFTTVQSHALDHDQFLPLCLANFQALLDYWHIHTALISFRLFIYALIYFTDMIMRMGSNTPRLLHVIAQ